MVEKKDFAVALVKINEKKNCYLVEYSLTVSAPKSNFTNLYKFVWLLLAIYHIKRCFSLTHCSFPFNDFFSFTFVDRLGKLSISTISL